jgi:hypothetical protein
VRNGEQGSHLVGVRGWDGADEVDAAVELDQVAASEAFGDLMARDAKIEQLAPRDDPMLPGGELGNEMVDGLSVGLDRYIRLNPTVTWRASQDAYARADALRVRHRDPP